jgi:hypothetical protein
MILISPRVLALHISEVLHIPLTPSNCRHQSVMHRSKKPPHLLANLAAILDAGIYSLSQRGPTRLVSYTMVCFHQS